MEPHDPAAYGDRFAEVYDDWYPAGPETDEVVAVLARLAGDGPVLELGVGTGRLAIPLAATGLTVHGVDASAAMLGRLAAKPGAERVTAMAGDFGDLGSVAGAEGPYALALAAYNTLFNLPTQDAQVACVAGVAARLAPGGRFVVEAFAPDAERLASGAPVGVSRVDDDGVVLSVTRHDPVAQRLETRLVALGPAGTRVYPSAIRYAWPSELDLMARLAGLALEHRWGGWAGEPFGADSAVHVSVYRRG